MNTGLAGKIARAFITSKLTPLIVAASLILGLFAVAVTPREEEPQISVPMIDVFVQYPGATAREVEERVTTPMEKLLWEIKGVEYVYSIAGPSRNLTIVRFRVGEDQEESIVKLYNKLYSNFDRIPPGVSQPLIKPRTIDDVPILSLTLWSKRYGGFELRKLASELADEIKKDDAVSEVTVIGGQRRQVRVSLDPARLKARSISAFEVMGAIGSANFNLPGGSIKSSGREYIVETGGFLESIEEVNSVVVGARDGRPVYLMDVAVVTDGPEEPSNYVFMGLGPGAASKGIARAGHGVYEAVTIAVAKKPGANASVVAVGAIEKTDALKGTLIPNDVNVTTTRNYGETAKEKSDELLEHMMIATIAVIVLVALALGVREAAVVAVAVPVTLALTLLVNYLYGYTLNRVTLFALIFSIGILVDDAIVVVENIHRHLKMKGISIDAAVEAVDEVGNPTILATFTVIAALLPMAFVSGLMGPYMRPIPVGASAAMIFSLLVAFIVSPWLGYKVLKKTHKGGAEGTRLSALYERLFTPFIDSKRLRYSALASVIVLLLLALALVPLKGVTVKMLPFDNKSELQIVIDSPEGTTLEDTARLTGELGEYLKTVPEVTDFQSYIGTSSPYNFNGLVRHYFLRMGPNMADMQVNFLPKGERSAQSHEIAKRLRPVLKEIADRHGARIKLAEVPPGPPVLSTLVAEIYGPTQEGRIALAREIKGVFETTDGVVDVDWYVEDDERKYSLEVDRSKASAIGISVEDASKALRIALSGASIGLLHAPSSKDPVEITLRLPEERRGLNALKEMTVPTPSGTLVPLSAIVRERETTEEKTIYHKNLKSVTYVIGDVAGAVESPVYAILGISDRIKREVRSKEGYEIRQYTSRQPWLEERYSIKWDGEWHITYEVFRDLGVAFAAVLVLIYILVVAWFRSFITPLVIMAPIPLTLVGILPGHWAFGAFFTATSMIGFIALAGIIVRNSILLVDFIELERKAGASLKEAAIRAGSVRLRPILLTALAVVAGSFVMLFDPIFQGLAISMMFGAIASTGLTLIAVPLLYYEVFKGREGRG
ncbi:MAG: efflux RND transporter permease subunit [Deltaproteobacteria bacterium]|nr:efflux RND transporter permease subunit [Deltaproteobacteria bacterium]